MMTSQASLNKKIQEHTARVGVLGLGYVGLPLACEFAKTGFDVTGFEVDASKVKSLQAGKSYIGDIESAEIQEQTARGHLHATRDFSQLRRMDAIIICVPTPLNKTKEPDISFIEGAARHIASNLRRGQLIVLESTTYPGTTRDCVLPLLQKKAFQVGKDFFLSFSPERIDPGNREFTLPNTPKVVGGLTPACGELTATLYGQIVRQVVQVSNAETAELTKLLENTFRAVNIGLVNEIMLICDKLGLNVWEVIDAAATKPYGFMPFYPGPGLGGHCIPIDPHYLSWRMKALNFAARFIELAGEVNSHMPDFVVDKIVRAFNDRRKSVKGSRILILGVAYKANVSDVRESPSLDVIHLLSQRGAWVSFHDPYVPAISVGGQRMKGRPYSAALLRRQDAVVIITAHDAFRPKEILKNARLVIDTRNMLRGFTAPHLIRL
jgi:UDP-N-acetyl-D-glucosamine dehydrogenase